MLFTSFMFLHFFNLINSRKVRAGDLNVFEHIFNNFFFMGVFAAIVAVQFVLVQYGGLTTNCVELDGRQFAYCVLVGSSALIVSALIKVLPDRFDNKLPKVVDEDSKGADNKIMRFYNAQANAKASDMIPKKAQSLPLPK